MARPLSYSKYIAALKAEGLNVVEVRTNERSPQYHNRNHKGKWGPVHGVMIHHTVTEGTAHTVELCRKGYTNLPGPLCTGVIAKDGTVYVVGYGRCNHAGLGDDDVLDAVIDEEPIPADNEANTDGNARFYGFECENLGDGKDPWPEAQLDAIDRASAALIRAHGWNVKGEGEESVIGHKEWQPGKPDPRGVNMDRVRDRVEDRLKHDAGWSPDSATSPKPSDDMYKVEKGDTLSSIAREYGTTWQELQKLNKLDDPNEINPGDEVKVPKKSKPSTPKHQPFPGASFFKRHPDSPIVTEMGKRLVAERCSRYNVGPGPQWSDADRQSYARWQRKCGFYGSAADGYPGKVSWDRLKVPFVK